jgi:hypothetical protein
MARNNTKKNTSRPWAVVQYDNRPLSDIDKTLIARNKHYCSKYGYTHIFKNSGYDDLPPYWRKVKFVQDLLQSNKYKGIMWLDTDATVFNMKISLDSIEDITKHFYKAINIGGNQIFNAGVWIIRDTQKGRDIMNDWMALYNPNKWKHTGNNWSTNDDWAGKEYEQGSFAYKIVPKYNKNIKTVKEPFFQGTNSSRNDIFVLHFYNYHKDKRQDFINKCGVDKC